MSFSLLHMAQILLSIFYIKFFIEKEFFFNKIIRNKLRRKIDNHRICEGFNNVIHRASYAKYLRSEKHLENEKQNEMILPEWVPKEPNEIKNKQLYNPKSFKQ